MDILHLEDSANDAELVEALILAEWPECRIERIAHRPQFQAAINQGGFDLILSDYAMPDFDGMSALHMARETCPEKPFIFLSGTIGEERAIDALRHGATDYIIKDRPSRLIPAIKQALLHAEETNLRMQTEQTLRENQERFRLITENVADMISVHNLDGLRVYHNPAYELTRGDSASEIATDAFNNVHPDDRDRIRAIFNDTVSTGAQHRSDYRLMLADGTKRHIESQASVIRDDGGNVSHVLIVSRDVTERKQSEKRVGELAALLERAQDAIYVRDLNQHITYWNQGAERLYGWTQGEVLGRRAVELLYKQDNATLQAIRQTVLTQGEWVGELHQINKHGKEVIVIARRNLLRDDQGQPASILNINTDITEQRKLEVQLLRNQRMESIGTLTGGIAHDLNNVLSPILMGADLLSYSVLSDSARRTVDAITTSAKHGAELVRQLLAFARGTDGERAPVQVEALLNDLLILLRQTLPNSIEISLDCPADGPLVLADATQLKQVVLNVCINARDAMPDGGGITISTQNVSVDADSPADNVAGEYLRISVNDTGTGMSPEVVEKIFDPFFTTKEIGKGTGLGLSTVHGIIKGHGGFLQVDSKPGSGTTFHLHLPVLAKEPTVGEPTAPVSKGPEGHGATILIIDEDPGIQEIMRTLLEHHHYRVLTAGNGRDGIKCLHENLPTIALVITDLFLPVKSGTEVITEVRALKPTLPVIVVASLTLAKQRMPGFDPKAVAAALDKPINATLLLETLHRVVPT